MPVSDELFVILINIDFGQEFLVGLLLSTAGEDPNIVSIWIVPWNNSNHLFSFEVFVSELLWIKFVYQKFLLALDLPTMTSKNMEDEVIDFGVFGDLFEHLSVFLTTFFFLNVFKFVDVLVFYKEIFLKEILCEFTVI